ncbi:MAG: peptidase C39, partial [Planctomycetota bacterium]
LAGSACLRGGRMGTPSVRNVLLIETLLLSLIFGWFYCGQLVWAAWLTDANTVYWSNGMPILLALTAGVAWRCRGLGRFHRPVTVGALLMLALGYLLLPLMRPVIHPLQLSASSQWKGRVCMQSTSSSCAPAAAATLLAEKGLVSKADATGMEARLAGLCLSSNQGTVALGLYRGLAMEATRGGYQAQVADTNPRLWIGQQQLPNVALVRFEARDDDSRFRQFIGRSDRGHAVCVLGRTDGGRWLIGDPAIGVITWSDEEFDKRFLGDAIYLASSGNN